MSANTLPFNMTGHPALSIPASESDGLPVGVMLITKMSADAGLLRVARTYEACVGWVPKSADQPDPSAWRQIGVSADRETLRGCSARVLSDL